MVPTSPPSLHEVDWSKIPAPADDGAARHLTGLAVPDVALAATDGTELSLARLPGRVVVFAYPRTGVPGQVSPVPDWDMIPGARGCTPQACAYRDLHKELTAAGATRVLGLSTQDTAYQREAAERLHLPFPLLSDERLVLAKAMRLPLMEAGGMTLIKRLAVIVDDGRIGKVFYPVFPPDRNAGDVLAWLEQNKRP
jgi:peroxiredoxin